MSYEYDIRDRIKKMTDQLGKVENYGYDPNDKLVSVTDRNNHTTKYNYDLLGRLEKALFSDNSQIKYYYDALSRLTTVDDTTSGLVQYVYSDAGCTGGCSSGVVDKVIQEITPLGSISYGYDAIGRRTKAEVAGQEPVYYSYDPIGRLVGLVQGEKTVTFTYDVIGRRTAMTLPNGVIASYAYDAAGRLKNITYSVGAEVLKSLDYTYDDNGNRSSLNGHQTLLPAPFTAAYNSSNQMITFKGENLAYDENGNLIQKGDTT